MLHVAVSSVLAKELTAERLQGAVTHRNAAAARGGRRHVLRRARLERAQKRSSATIDPRCSSSVLASGR